MRNVRFIGIAGLAALVLACATVDPASARGGGGGGGHGGGHGGSMMGGGHGGPGGGKGMMGGFVIGGQGTSSQGALSCRNNRTAPHCRG